MLKFSMGAYSSVSPEISPNNPKLHSLMQTADILHWLWFQASVWTPLWCLPRRRSWWPHRCILLLFPLATRVYFAGTVKKCNEVGKDYYLKSSVLVGLPNQTTWNVSQFVPWTFLSLDQRLSFMGINTLSNQPPSQK